MNNAGKLRRSKQRNDVPVIGDEFDLETYGRPTTGTGHAARAHRPQRVTSYSLRTTPVEPQPETPRRRPARSAEVAEPVIRAERIEGESVRTVKIKGQATPARRRAAVQIERYERRPDRAAQWALFMGVFMIVVAIVTGT